MGLIGNIVINYGNTSKTISVSDDCPPNENYLVNGYQYYIDGSGGTIVMPYVGCVSNVVGYGDLGNITWDYNAIYVEVPINAEGTDVSFWIRITWCNDTTNDADIYQGMYTGSFKWKKKYEKVVSRFYDSKWYLFLCDEYEKDLTYNNVGANNRNFTKAVIGNCVSGLDASFKDCFYLSSVTFVNDSQVTEIGNEAFRNCAYLFNIAIPRGVTSIGGSAFSGCHSLSSFTIPSGVTSIGANAFSDSISLTSITIPSGVPAINLSTFSGCIRLKDVQFSENSQLATIEGGAFNGCASLTSIAIPSGVTTISYTNAQQEPDLYDLHSNVFDSNVFTNCCSLSSITVDPNNTVFDSRDNCNAIIKTSSNTLITGCKNTVIPNSVVAIGASAFYGCNGLTSIIIPNSVNKIGLDAFKGCGSLPIENGIMYASTYLVEATSKTQTSYTIKSDTRFIGDDAFSGCTSLSSITIPCSVISIGEDAFNGCSGITNDIHLGSGVTFIGTGAFAFCSGINRIYIAATTPPTLKMPVLNIGVEPFLGTNIYICVHDSCLTAYQTAIGWRNYSSRIISVGDEYFQC